MKILVTAKRAPDPEQKVKLKGDAIDLTGMNFVVNPFDEYAVEEAVCWTQHRRVASSSDLGGGEPEAQAAGGRPQPRQKNLQDVLSKKFEARSQAGFGAGSTGGVSRC